VIKPLATPPLKNYTTHDIETLIDHFLGVSWGSIIPPGEATVGVEATKGNNSFYLVSDGGNIPPISFKMRPYFSSSLLDFRVYTAVKK